MIIDGVTSDGYVETHLGRIAADQPDGTSVQVMVRPEWVLPTKTATGACTITDREFYGHDQRVEISLPQGPPIEALIPGRLEMQVGDVVDIEVVEAIVFAKAAQR